MIVRKSQCTNLIHPFPEMKGRIWGRDRIVSPPILPERTPVYYVPLLVTLHIMLFLCYEGCLGLHLTNHRALEGRLWSLGT